jgi:hypothetical protein
MKRLMMANILTQGLAACVLLGLAGCTSTRQVDVNQQSGFLGNYFMLQKGGVREDSYVYVDRRADWSKYTKVWLKPVEFWHAADPESPLGKLSTEDQQMLLDSLRVALVEALTNSFQLTDQAGPDVLVIRAALTDGRPSRPVPGMVSGVYVPLRVASYGNRAVADPGVGRVVVEADLTDGQTGKRVAAVVDGRVGPRAMPSQFDSTRSDVKKAFDWLAQGLDKRLMLFKDGDFKTSSL